MNGFDDPFWSVEQSIGWIASRDPELVSACSPSLIEQLAELRRHPSNSHLTHPLEDYCRNEMTAAQDYGEFKKASDDLHSALQAGRITATGLFYDGRHRLQIGYTPPRTEIDRLLWADHRIEHYIQGFHVVSRHGASLRYGKIRLEKMNVLRMWPQQVQSHKSTIGAKTAVIKELKRMMEENPDKQPGTKEQIRENLKKQYDLSTDSFNKAWSEAKGQVSAPGWARAGRPKKNDSPKSSG